MLQKIVKPLGGQVEGWNMLTKIIKQNLTYVWVIAIAKTFFDHNNPYYSFHLLFEEFFVLISCSCFVLCSAKWLQ